MKPRLNLLLVISAFLTVSEIRRSSAGLVQLPIKQLYSQQPTKSSNSCNFVTIHLHAATHIVTNACTFIIIICVIGIVLQRGAQQNTQQNIISNTEQRNIIVVGGSSNHGQNVPSTQLSHVASYTNVIACACIITTVCALYRSVSYMEPKPITYTKYSTERECCPGYSGHDCEGLWFNGYNNNSQL